MATLKIAHIREQGVDLIIVPMDRTFGGRPTSAQRALVGELQAQSIGAKLAGTVIPVWDYGRGQMGFLAPQGWHPFFQSIDLSWVFANVNRELHFTTAGDRLAVALDLPRRIPGLNDEACR